MKNKIISFILIVMLLSFGNAFSFAEDNDLNESNSKVDKKLKKKKKLIFKESAF